MLTSIFLILQLVILNFITRTGADRLLTGNVACGIRNLGRFACEIRTSWALESFFPFFPFFGGKGGGVRTKTNTLS